MNRFWKKVTPLLLTALAIAGIGATAVAAVKAKPEADKRLNDAQAEKGEALTPVEAAKAAAPAYLPAIGIGAGTVGCIIGLNLLNAREQASMASAYALLQQSYKRYGSKVKEALGIDGETELRNAISREEAKEQQPEPPKDGRKLYFVEHYGKFFEKLPEEVSDAEYFLNRNFALRGDATLSEFFELLGLEQTKASEVLGWSADAGCEFYGYQWIDFEHRLFTTEDGLECTAIEFPFPPTLDYNRDEFIGE